MSVLSLAQVLRSYFLFSTVGFAFISDEALANYCQVYPSEYAYRDNSVIRAESTNANCRRYPLISGLPADIFSSDYIHCDGTQLKLADTNLGSEQFRSSSHYQWNASSAEQLLFIFPTRVTLTFITLHYYSDSVRGLPRLRFYVVPDDFDVWDALTSGNPYVGVASVPPGGEPVGRRNISINTNFNTMKVLMYKYSSNFLFAVSEVEFFTCIEPITTTSQPTTSTSSGTTTIPLKITTTESFEVTEDGAYGTQSSSSLQIRANSRAREIIVWILMGILPVIHAIN